MNEKIDLDYYAMQHYSRYLYKSEGTKERDISLEELIKSEESNILPAPYFFAFYDHELSKLIHVSPKVEEVYGISQETIYEDNEHLLFDVILEDEKLAVIECVKNVWDAYYQHGEDYVSERVFSAEYRVQNKKGDFLHVMHQNEVLTFTESGLPKTAIARFIDMNWLFGENKRRVVKFYIYNRKSNEIECYDETEISVNTEIRITAREEEILELINYGYNSQKIAEELDISIETVKTHRKNIKAKQANA